jgi:hypothetical protein
VTAAGTPAIALAPGRARPIGISLAPCRTSQGGPLAGAVPNPSLSRKKRTPDV